MEWIIEDPLFALFVLALLALGVLLLILWTLLPFSVFGIQSRLDTVIEYMESIGEQQKLLALLMRDLIHRDDIPRERQRDYREEEHFGRYSGGKEIA